MEDILFFVVYAIIAYPFIFLLFHLILKLLDGEDEMIDFLIEEIKTLKKKCYGYIRKRFRKKGSEVNADGATVQNDGELYDSSSVWED